MSTSSSTGTQARRGRGGARRRHSSLVRTGDQGANHADGLPVAPGGPSAKTQDNHRGTQDNLRPDNPGSTNRAQGTPWGYSSVGSGTSHIELASATRTRLHVREMPDCPSRHLVECLGGGTEGYGFTTSTPCSLSQRQPLSPRYRRSSSLRSRYPPCAHAPTV
jgi:hypothetical protein